MLLWLWIGIANQALGSDGSGEPKVIPAQQDIQHGLSILRNLFTAFLMVFRWIMQSAGSLTDTLRVKLVGQSFN
ncbi:hypothetical protein Q766_06930 [Flavobacterium subsaxonicum WB 4.1-42 = DSM 21790]|uniref:Uncharacterized protein n=1 Tax=Flavobacterium subsaxonicum WB 4.1-42 = DSM 21790 TaxID=1121898 RepID=A0A0A2MM43_9FLAO|nr:hypothetical protein Q766_06930 [Flavobacterium subsaxonicum WB 4.1-42 = DSM 21790]